MAKQDAIGGRLRSPFLFVAFRNRDVAHPQQVQTNGPSDRWNSCKRRGMPQSKHSTSDMRLKINRESEVMHGQIDGGISESEVIPFSRAESTSTSDSHDQLDKAGQTILQMLHRAAGVAEENSRHALETAQKLSHQLRAAENRVSELEAEVAAYQERAERAEQWLHRVYTEIEDRFLRQNNDRSGTTQRSQRANRR
jgi:hypothetical protein